jgi:hypothetical protein
VQGRSGLLLVEAKAHSNELHRDGKGKNDNIENDGQIRSAIAGANLGLNAIQRGRNLTVDSHYQLCNRFGWAWKLSSLGIPVILVYLGFLNASEMSDRGHPFDSEADWERAMYDHSAGIVPKEAWGKPIAVSGTPLIPLIRSTLVRLGGQNM